MTGNVQHTNMEYSGPCFSYRKHQLSHSASVNLATQRQANDKSVATETQAMNFEIFARLDVTERRVIVTDVSGQPRPQL
jgi:hypothetical protein